MVQQALRGRQRGVAAVRIGGVDLGQDLGEVAARFGEILDHLDNLASAVRWLCARHLATMVPTGPAKLHASASLIWVDVEVGLGLVPLAAMAPAGAMQADPGLAGARPTITKVRWARASGRPGGAFQSKLSMHGGLQRHEAHVVGTFGAGCRQPE